MICECVNVSVVSIAAHTAAREVKDSTLSRCASVAQ